MKDFYHISWKLELWKFIDVQRRRRFSYWSQLFFKSSVSKTIASYFTTEWWVSVWNEKRSKQQRAFSLEEFKHVKLQFPSVPYLNVFFCKDVSIKIWGKLLQIFLGLKHYTRKASAVHKIKVNDASCTNWPFQKISICIEEVPNINTICNLAKQPKTR